MTRARAVVHVALVVVATACRPASPGAERQLIASIPLKCLGRETSAVPRLITLTTIADCAVCRDHLAMWDEYPVSDRAQHVVVVYAPIGRVEDAKAVVRAQTQRPFCVDPVGAWIEHLRPAVTPTTLLVQGDRARIVARGPVSAQQQVAIAALTDSLLRTASGR